MISRVCRQVRDHRLQTLPLGIETCSYASCLLDRGLLCVLCPLTLRIHHCLLPWLRMQKPGSPARAEKCSSGVPVRSQSSKLQLSHATCGEASLVGLEVPRERGSPVLHSRTFQACPVQTPAEFPWVNCLPHSTGSSASHSRLHTLIQTLGLRAGHGTVRWDFT